MVARNLVENCPDLKVRNLFTIGGPHRGVDEVPYCDSGVWCYSINAIAESYSNNPEIQHEFHPASYFRDVDNLPLYMKNSIFLPYLNNEKDFSA